MQVYQVFVKRLNSQSIIVENYRWVHDHGHTIGYEFLGLSVEFDKSHKNYSEMMEWGRFDRRAWHYKYGDHFDREYERYEKIRKAKHEQREILKTARLAGASRLFLR